MGLSAVHDDAGKILLVHRTSGFDRSLEELRRRGGAASVAAGKATEVTRLMTHATEKGGREQFRLTWNGESRIKYCRKYNLGGGYRLVLIHRGRHRVLLYVGSHDDCFRWIERNSRMKYKMDKSTSEMRVLCDTPAKNDSIPNDGLEEPVVDEYEAALMSRIDDSILRKVFSGLINQSHGGT